MRTIHKYPLLVTEEQGLDLPIGHVLLTAQVQRGDVCIWAEVDDTETLRTAIKVKIVGTGHAIPYGWVYLATVQPTEYTALHVYYT